ncbi:MAG TPA: hypothetical protein VFS24_19560 [Steroidobacteraceae bacterium]|nr:hypothetical protein [Steroidobacteraceae bacterium]
MLIRSVAILAFSLSASLSNAQFLDSFDKPQIEGWMPITGDGNAKLQMEARDGYGRMDIDATHDKYGVWWTCIKRDVTKSLDMKRLARPDYELRVEAKVRGSVGPRRVNFMINTQRTTNYHQHLREFDIAQPNEWHTISMTTQDLDAKPGDTVFVQFCATDWGLDRYAVDLDYYRADVVKRGSVKDVGEPLVYHPAVPDPATFQNHLAATHDSVINLDFPDVNFNDWHIDGQDGSAPVLTVDGNQWIVLRWDLDKFRGTHAQGPGLLELTTHNLAIGGKYIQAMGQDFGEEFGKIHVIEILGGDPQWDQNSVTYNNLTRGAKYEDVFNTQMIIDYELGSKPGDKTFFTIPRPVMQRLLDGTTKGLLIRPLGAVSGSVYASESKAGNGPKLHF